MTASESSSNSYANHQNEVVEQDLMDPDDCA